MGRRLQLAKRHENKPPLAVWPHLWPHFREIDEQPREKRFLANMLVVGRRSRLDAASPSVALDRVQAGLGSSRPSRPRRTPPPPLRRADRSTSSIIDDDRRCSMLIANRFLLSGTRESRSSALHNSMATMRHVPTSERFAAVGFFKGWNAFPGQLRSRSRRIASRTGRTAFT